MRIRPTTEHPLDLSDGVRRIADGTMHPLNGRHAPMSADRQTGGGLPRDSRLPSVRCPASNVGRFRRLTASIQRVWFNHYL